MASTLTAAIGDPESHRAINEDRRRRALHSLRNESFRRVLDSLSLLRPLRSLSLLDVGCAHGWFLQAATRRGIHAFGIEPDEVIASQARNAGVSVFTGYFPEDLPSHAHYDVITFNDVFEHLPAPVEAVRACSLRLNPGGLLAITLPSSKGVLFRSALLLHRVGIQAALDRLWQRGFPSPHLTYFHPDGLNALLTRCGFREVHRSSFPSMSGKGLWQRLRYDVSASLASSLLTFALLSPLIPLMSLMPSDISFQVFERADNTEESGVQNGE